MNIIEKKEYKYSDMVTKLHKEVLLRRPGEQLLSEPSLAQRFGVSRGTVRKALRKLEDLGCISRKQGHGTFIREIETSSLERSEYVFLFSGNYDANPYVFDQLRGIEKAVSGNHGVAIYKSVDDKSWLDEDVKGFFEQRTDINGILVDGDINNVHMHSLQAMNIPFILMGNHNISTEFPQISYDFSFIFLSIG